MLFTFTDQVMSWYVNGREKELSRIALEHGFDTLRVALNVRKEDEWRIIFDNFVVYSGLIVVLVVKNMSFFVSLLLSRGSSAVREILQISDEKYDEIWGVLLDVMLDGFCGRKYREKRLEDASKSLDEILALLNSYEKA